MKQKGITQFWKPLALLLVLSFLSACSLPSASSLIRDLLGDNQNAAQSEENQPQTDQSQAQNEEPTQNDANLEQTHPNHWVINEHGGITFWYDPEVIQELRAATIKEAQSSPGVVSHPDFVQYSLPLDNGTIAVVEVVPYKRMSTAVDEILPQVRDLLSNRNFLDLDCIPELPLVALYRQCSHQQFNANVEFIDFQNGYGMRFVTVYGIQDAVPISNQNLVYVYQGLTKSQQCYVTASFKITHEKLEDHAEIPRDIYRDVTGIALAEYFSDHQELLANSPDGYSPALEHFDQIMQSIEVIDCSGD